MPVEKIANAFILTLLIEMMVGVLVSSLSVGDVTTVLKNLRFVAWGGVAILRDYSPCLACSVHGQAYSHEASIRGGDNRMLRQDHRLRVDIPSGCSSFRAAANCSQAVGLL